MNKNQRLSVLAILTLLLSICWSAMAAAATKSSANFHISKMVYALCRAAGADGNMNTADDVVCPENLVAGNGNFANNVRITSIRDVELVNDFFGGPDTADFLEGVTPLKAVRGASAPTTSNTFTLAAPLLPEVSNGLAVAVVTDSGTVYWFNPGNLVIVDKTVTQSHPTSSFAGNLPRWAGQVGNKRLFWGLGGKAWKKPDVKMYTQANTGIKYIEFRTNSGYYPSFGRYGAMHKSKIANGCLNSDAFPATNVLDAATISCSLEGTKATANANGFNHRIRFADAWLNYDEANPVLVGQSNSANAYLALMNTKLFLNVGLSFVNSIAADGTVYRLLRIGTAPGVPELRANADGSVTMSARNPYLPNMSANIGTPVKFGVNSPRNGWIYSKKVDIITASNGLLVATLPSELIADNDKNATFFVENANGDRAYFGDQWDLVNMTRNADYSINYGNFTQASVSYNDGNLILNFGTNKVTGFSDIIASGEQICLRSDSAGWSGCAKPGVISADSLGHKVATFAGYTPAAEEVVTVANSTSTKWLDIGQATQNGYWKDPVYTVLDNGSDNNGGIDTVFFNVNYYFHVTQ